MLAIFVYFILPVILLCIGFPIYLILLLSSLIAVLFVADVQTTVIQTNMFGSLDNFPLLAIPFFILAGEIMGQGGKAWGDKGGEVIMLSPADKAELMAKMRPIADDIAKTKPELKPLWEQLIATAQRSN